MTLVTDLKFDPKKGYSFGQKTFYSDHHLGIDLVSNKTPLEFPVDLFNCTFLNGKQGGLTVCGEDSLGYIHRFMHNSEFKVKTPTILAGTTFAVSGTTGALSKGDHVHWDIRNPGTPRSDLSFKNYIDPVYWKSSILPAMTTLVWEQTAKAYGISTGICTNWDTITVNKYEVVEIIRKFELYLAAKGGNS